MPGKLVFLPTYNERDNIAGIVRDVLSKGADIEALVVDDNSPDGTADAVREIAKTEPRCHLLLRETDRGRGRAQADALRWFMRRDYGSFIEMDADGSHNPNYIPAIIDALKSADIVICSRLIPGGGERDRSITRKLLTIASNLFIRSTLGLKARDCTTGYRGFTRAAISAIDPDSLVSPGPAIVQEMLYILVRKGFAATEIPFIFEPRAAGRSKLNIATLALSISNVLKIKAVHGKAPPDS